MTKGDKIRQMSDEELAKMLFFMTPATCCLIEELGGTLFYECDLQCVNCATNWLREEVQKDG